MDSRQNGDVGDIHYYILLHADTARAAAQRLLKDLQQTRHWPNGMGHSSRKRKEDQGPNETLLRRPPALNTAFLQRVLTQNQSFNVRKSREPSPQQAQRPAQAEGQNVEKDKGRDTDKGGRAKEQAEAVPARGKAKAGRVKKGEKRKWPNKKLWERIHATISRDLESNDE